MNNEEVKTFYNKVIKSEYAGTYEYKRWFATPERKAGFDSTKDTIESILHKYSPVYENYLELGPGPGTWSEVFLTYHDKASMDLVDISEEMLRMTRERFKDQTNISCIQSDFLLYQSVKKYNLFFSSRAIEYFMDKVALVKKIDSLLDRKALGIIITKMPHYKRARLFRRVPDFHASQIAPSLLEDLLKKEGFEVLGVYGTTFVFPLLRSGMLDRLLYRLFSKHKVNVFTSFFLESYTVVFRKV